MDETRERCIGKAHEVFNKLKEDGKLPTPEQKFRRHPTPLRAIRLHCIECQGGSRKAPLLCEDRECHLYQYRTGHKPIKKSKTSAKGS